MESTVTQQINKIRDKEQKKSLNAWAKQGFVGSVIAGTGFGKSRVGVLAVNHALKSGGKALILVPTIQLQEQFKEEFVKWGLEDCLDNTEILCYQTAYKLIGEEYDL